MPDAVERIELLTRKGGRVAILEIPRLAPPADVITWGGRTFVLRHHEQSDRWPLTYREARALTVAR
jgi:hypothetical protein